MPKPFKVYLVTYEGKGIKIRNRTIAKMLGKLTGETVIERTTTINFINF